MGIFDFFKKGETLDKTSISISPNIDGSISGMSANEITGFVYDKRDELMKTSNKDSTLILLDVLTKYGLYWTMIAFNDFEKSKSFVNHIMGEYSNDIIEPNMGISRTTDGATMIIGGDFRTCEEGWMKIITNLGKKDYKKSWGIVNVQFPAY